MTSKMLLVNTGPDPIRVRQVYYSPADVVQGKPAQLVDEFVIPIGGSAEVWVHYNFQILVGERPAESAARDEIVTKLALETGLPVEVLERHLRRPSSVELRRNAAQILTPRDDPQNKSE